MISRGYVRLMAAAFAAVGLHALVFIFFPSFQAVLQSSQGSALQVELLKRQAAMQARPADSRHGQQRESEQQRLATDKKPLQVAKNRARVVNESHRKAKKAAEQIMVKQSVAKQPSHVRPLEAAPGQGLRSVSAHHAQARVFMDVAKAGAVAPDTATARVSTHALEQQYMAVPQGVQARILAQVHYPRLARRHGWQGRAEFQLDIQQQSIHAVTLLASTGYPVLDRAAHRGLNAIHMIPLSNGLYRMPVVFRLQ